MSGQEFVDFIQWCFRDAGSGFTTIIVLLVIGEIIAGIIHALR